MCSFAIHFSMTDLSWSCLSQLYELVRNATRQCNVKDSVVICQILKFKKMNDHPHDIDMNSLSINFPLHETTDKVNMNLYLYNLLLGSHELNIQRGYCFIRHVCDLHSLVKLTNKTEGFIAWVPWGGLMGYRFRISGKTLRNLNCYVAKPKTFFLSDINEDGQQIFDKRSGVNLSVTVTWHEDQDDNRMCFLDI